MIFQPALIYLDRQGQLSGSLGSGLSEWLNGKRIVLSRAICSHERIKNDPALSKQNQLRRAYLHAIEKSPYENPGVFISTENHGTAIWSWDAAAVESQTGEKSLLCVPESAFYKGLEDGFYVVQCLDGFEGLYCNNKEVVLSRWWPKAPSQNDWLRFTLNAEQFGAKSAPIPDPITVKSFRRSSPPQNQIGHRDVVRIIDKPRLISLAVLVAALITLYPVARWAHLSAQSAALGSKLSGMSAQFDERLQQMKERSDLSASIDVLAKAVDAEPAFIPFAEGVSIIQDAGGDIHRVAFGDGAWEVGFSADAGFSETELVRILEENPTLTSASVEADRRENYWVVRFRNATEVAEG